MDGVDKAAVLLLGIGEQNAAQVLKYLEPKQVQRVGAAMTHAAKFPKDQIDSVFDSFLKDASEQSSIAVDTEKYVKKVLVSALGENRATSILDRILSGNHENGLDALKWLDAKVVADLIRNEHPQIIATILTYLDSEQAAEIVSYFPNEKRPDLLFRMSAIDSVKPDALSQLGSIIERQLVGHTRGKTAALGGIKSVADVINHLERSIETEVLDWFKDKDEELCQKIRDLMFIFENLYEVDDRSMQTLLREINSEVLILALKGADDRMKEKIFSNMSKRAAELMKDDLEAKGPVKVSEVENAQREILAVAQKLADSGEISLGSRGGGEEMI